jgi:hypothetical protein
MSAELTPRVAALIGEQARTGDPLELVVELEGGDLPSAGNRAERIAVQKARFEHAAAPVKDFVLRAGGTIEGEAWINCTLRARVPSQAVSALRELAGVRKIDVPHVIFPDR